MTRDDPTDVLIELLKRVPILSIDVEAAKARGDEAQLEYAAAVTLWTFRAAKAVSEIQQSQLAHARHAAPDAFARAAEASALMRSPAAE